MHMHTGFKQKLLLRPKKSIHSFQLNIKKGRHTVTVVFFRTMFLWQTDLYQGIIKVFTKKAHIDQNTKNKKGSEG